MQAFENYVEKGEHASKINKEVMFEIQVHKHRVLDEYVWPSTVDLNCLQLHQELHAECQGYRCASLYGIQHHIKYNFHCNGVGKCNYSCFPGGFLFSYLNRHFA